MSKKVSRADEAMEELMTVIHKQVDGFDKIEKQEDRNKAAESVAELADKVQKLEDTSNARATGDRDFWLKVCTIAAEIGVSLLGLAFMQRNLKYIHRYEGENVINGIGRTVASDALTLGRNILKSGINVMKWYRF